MLNRKVLRGLVALAHLLAAGILMIRMAAVMAVIGAPELATQTVRAIWIQTAVLSVPLLLLLIGVAGIWRARPWGWRAAAAADSVLVLLVIGDWLLGGQRVDHGPVLVILVVLILPFLVPRLRAWLVSTAA
jgi:hypothetical protein